MMHSLPVQPQHTSAEAALSDPVRLSASWRPALLIFAIALLVRIAVLPFATFDSGDSASRVWIAWRWMEHPTLITSGVWGPLHFYLVGLALMVWPDPVWAPAVLSVLLGSLAAVVVYFLALEIFRAPRAALVTGLSFAFYPTAVAVSLFALSEPPFILFFGLGLLFLVRATRPNGTVQDALFAGIAIGLATMLRFESWFMLPFLALTVVRRPKLLIAFLLPALIHPAIWMIGNAITYNDPFYNFSWASNWERNDMGQGKLVSISSALSRFWGFIHMTQSGLGPPLTLLVITGAVWCVWRRCKGAIWLVPPLALLAMLAAAAGRGSLVVKWEYTSTLGLMLVPFAACILEAIGIEAWPRRRFIAATVGSVGAILLFTVEPIWRVVPHGGALLSRMIPAFPNIRGAREVLALVQRGLSPDHDALLSDFYGWQPTYYVGLHTKLHPDRISIVNGAPNDPPDLDSAAGFLGTYRQGVLIVRDQGKLGALLQTNPDQTIRLAGTILHLEPVGTLQWPSANGEPGQVVRVARYSVAGAVDSRAARRVQ
jgi:hypothetical protein